MNTSGNCDLAYCIRDHLPLNGAHHLDMHIRMVAAIAPYAGSITEASHSIQPIDFQS